jgi:hypothetical protein
MMLSTVRLFKRRAEAAEARVQELEAIIATLAPK